MTMIHPVASRWLIDGPGHDLDSSIARSDFGSHHRNRRAQQLPERGPKSVPSDGVAFRAARRSDIVNRAGRCWFQCTGIWVRMWCS